jgi:hypothetical protein
MLTGTFEAFGNCIFSFAARRLVHLAAFKDARHVIAIDIDRKLLDAAKVRFDERGLRKRRAPRPDQAIEPPTNRDRVPVP